MDTQRWKRVKLVAAGGARLVGEGKDVVRSNGRLAVRSALGRARANLGARGEAANTWPRGPLAPSYDVVVIGDGVGALAAADVLAQTAPARRVGVLVAGLVGQELPCRPRAVLRTVREQAAESAIVARSAALYEQYVVDRAMGLRLRKQPALVVACALDELPALHRLGARYEAAQLVTAAEATQLVDHLDPSGVAEAIVERDVLTVDVDELLWELAGRASAQGADIVEHCRVEGLETGASGWTVVTSRGRTRAEVVIDATSDGRALAAVGGAPTETWRRWESIVTQHVQPFMRAHLVVGGAEISQTARGEVVVAGHATPYPAREAGGSVEAASWLAGQALSVVPRLGSLRVIAQGWRADLVPADGLPSVGATRFEGLLRLGGTGADPMAFGPALGEAVAHLALGLVPRVDLADLEPGRPTARHDAGAGLHVDPVEQPSALPSLTR